MEVQNASADISLGFQLNGDEKDTDNCCYKRLIKRRVENGFLNEVYGKSTRPGKGAVVSNWAGVARVLSKRSVTKPTDSDSRNSNLKDTIQLEDTDITDEEKRKLPNGDDWPILNGNRRMNLRITVERCKSRLLNGEVVTNQKQDAEEPNEPRGIEIFTDRKRQETANVRCKLRAVEQVNVDLVSFRPNDSCKFSVFEEPRNEKIKTANENSCKCNVLQAARKNHKVTPGVDVSPRTDYQEVIYGSGLHTANGPVGSEADGFDGDEVMRRAITDTAFASNPVRLKQEYEVSTPGIASNNGSFLHDNNNSKNLCCETQLPLNGLVAKKFRGNDVSCKEPAPITNSSSRETCDSVINSKVPKERLCCTFKSICKEAGNFDDVSIQSRVCKNDPKKQNLFLNDIEKDAVQNGEMIDTKGCTVTTDSLVKSDNLAKVIDCGNKDVNSDCLCKWVNCNAMLNDAVELKTHVKEMHVKTMAASDLFFCFWKGCKVYNKPSSSYNWLVKHVNTHVGIRPFQCVIEPCDLSFASHSALVRHVQSHFNERSKYYKKTKRFSKESSVSPSARCKEDETMSSSESTSSKDLRKRRLKFFMRRTRPVTAYDTNDGFDRDSMDYVKKKLVSIDSSNYQINGPQNVMQPLGRRTSDKGEVQYLMSVGADKKQREWRNEKDALLDGALQFPVSKLPTKQQEQMYEGIFGTKVKRHRRKVKRSSINL